MNLEVGPAEILVCISPALLDQPWSKPIALEPCLPNALRWTCQWRLPQRRRRALGRGLAVLRTASSMADPAAGRQPGLVPDEPLREYGPSPRRPYVNGVAGRADGMCGRRCNVPAAAFAWHVSSTAASMELAVTVWRFGAPRSAIVPASGQPEACLLLIRS